MRYKDFRLMFRLTAQEMKDIDMAMLADKLHWKRLTTRSEFVRYAIKVFIADLATTDQARPDLRPDSAFKPFVIGTPEQDTHGQEAQNAATSASDSNGVEQERAGKVRPGGGKSPSSRHSAGGPDRPAPGGAGGATPKAKPSGKARKPNKAPVSDKSNGRKLSDAKRGGKR
jgi:hypothetical protein